jgi:hypothetical protein
LVHVCLSRADTGVLTLAPLKRVVMGARGPQSESRSLPPYTEPLAKQAQSGLVVSTEVVEPMAPLLSSGVDNLGREQTATEAVAT